MEDKEEPTRTPRRKDRKSTIAAHLKSWNLFHQRWSSTKFHNIGSSHFRTAEDTTGFDLLHMLSRFMGRADT